MSSKALLAVVWAMANGKPGRPRIYPEKRPENRLDRRRPAAGRCNAVLKGRGPEGEDLYCHSYPVADRERCRFHGGMIEARRFDFGPQDFYGRGWARQVPARLIETLAKGIDDQDLLSLRAEIQLTDARVGELLNRLESGEIPQAWEWLAGSVVDLQGCLAAEEPDLEWLRRIADRMAQALELKATDRTQWAEIQEWMEMRRKLADTERRREEALQNFINSKQLIAFMGMIQQAIVDEVHDPQTLSALTRRIRMLANRPELPSRTRGQLMEELVVTDNPDEEPDDGSQGGSPDPEPDDERDDRPDEPGRDGLGGHEPGADREVGGGPGKAEVPGEPGPDRGDRGADPGPEAAGGSPGGVRVPGAAGAGPADGQLRFSVE